MVECTLPKNGAYLDVDILIHSCEPNKMLKYRIDTAFSGTPVGESVFGCETLYDDEREAVYHKWCGITGEQDRLFVLNRGTYGGSFTPDSIKLSLLRTPVYAAHPIADRPIAPHDRWLDHIDMGERRFSFRITTEQNVSRAAQVYNEQVFPLSFFPSGEGKADGTAITVDDPRVILSSLRQTENGYQLTLYNSTETPCSANVILHATGQSRLLHLEKYEFQTITL